MHAPGAERLSRRGLTSLVFPTFNPGRQIEQTWREVNRFLRRARGEWEILFVCDGCTDGTTEFLERRISASSSPVRLLSYTPNRGKGHAVRLGLTAARGAWRLFADVDLAYGFDDMVQVAEALRDGAEVAIASRLHPESRLLLPAHLRGYFYRRRLQSAAFSALVRLLLPLTQRDTQAGLKGLSAHAVETLFPLLRCNGFGFDCELLTACAHFGLPVTEVPVCVRYETAASTIRLRGMGRMIRDLWSIRRRWRAARRETLPKVAVARQAA